MNKITMVKLLSLSFCILIIQPTYTCAFVLFNNNNNNGHPKITGNTMATAAAAATAANDDDSTTTDDTNTGDGAAKTDRNTNKRLILIRHGRTYMNEYLATPGTRWGDANFTDVFDNQGDYQDSPLSSEGLLQAQTLQDYFQNEEERQILDKEEETGVSSSVPSSLRDDIELVVVSPLTRTLQTAEIGLLPQYSSSSSCKSSSNDNNSEEEAASLVSSSTTTTTTTIPFVALPLASERVYLISDIGKPIQELKQKFPYVDFNVPNNDEDNNNNNNNDKWWFTIENEKEEYREWRPSLDGQVYACCGEPELYFNQRMMRLYNWISSRPEQTICIVSHYGVLQWLTGGYEFQNCELQDIPFSQIQQHHAQK